MWSWRGAGEGDAEGLTADVGRHGGGSSVMALQAVLGGEMRVEE